MINSKDYNEYKKYNKSLWYLLPLLSEDITPYKIKNHNDFLWKECLMNTYLRGIPEYDNTLERPLYLHYRYSNTDEFRNLEDYLTMDLGGNKYITTLDPSENDIIIVYNINNSSAYSDNSEREKTANCVEDYDKIISGKYYRLSTRHKLRILNFFYDKGHPYDGFLRLLLGRNSVLWEMRRKEIGCLKGNECVCSVKTKLIEFQDENGEKRMKPEADSKQDYLKCKNYSNWTMPQDVELESPPNLKEETYGFIQKKQVAGATA